MLGYGANIEIVPLTLTAGTTYWTMYNGGSSPVKIYSIFLMGDFIGTAAASRSVFGICRFSAAVPTGGTALNIINIDTTFANSLISDIRSGNGGLITTSVVFESYFYFFSFRNSISIAPTVHLNFEVMDFPFNRNYNVLTLNNGEGLAIRARSTIVAGAGLFGSIFWQDV